MKILLCPDKFKGSLSAMKVCDSICTGLQRVDENLTVIKLPVADGGDGSIEILKSILDLNQICINAYDPIGRNIESTYYYSDEAAFIELASASGLVLLDESERNPMHTSTLGTGLMIKDAIDRGLKKIYLFIGGSATNDGGIGIAQALGFDFLDDDEKVLPPKGSSLKKIRKIENNSIYNFNDLEIIALCDVNNPMHGSNGAAYVYAAQKGASKEEIIQLDNGLKNYANLINSQLNIDVSNLPGIGAAGAVGASLVGLINAKLENGFAMIAQITQLEKAIKKSDLVITGEGKIDQTSYQGKVVGNVIKLCKKNDIPYGLIAGIIDNDNQINNEDIIMKSVFHRAKDLNDAMLNAEKYLIDIGIDIAKNEFPK